MNDNEAENMIIGFAEPAEFKVKFELKCPFCNEVHISIGAFRMHINTHHQNEAPYSSRLFYSLLFICPIFVLDGAICVSVTRREGLRTTKPTRSTTRSTGRTASAAPSADRSSSGNSRYPTRERAYLS